MDHATAHGGGEAQRFKVARSAFDFEDFFAAQGFGVVQVVCAFDFHYKEFAFLVR